MGFGYNRYAVVLFALTIAAGTGCSSKSSNKGFASTTAATTSSSSAANTTSGSQALGSGPQFRMASFVDEDSNDMVSKGDKIVMEFDSDIEQISSSLDPATEFTLAVAGDSFGSGATVQAGGSAMQLEIVLGDNPVLRISDAFDIAKTTPGSSTGINIAFTSTLKGFDSGTVRAAAQPLDIDGALTAGFRAAGSLNSARGGHDAIELDDGRVLIVGGASASGKKGYVAEPEIYDPLTDTFTRVSDLSGDLGVMKRGKVTVRQINATAVKLTDGTVLICGGHGIEKKSFFGLGGDKEDTLESAFIFDPTTNEFRQVGDMQYARHSHTATVMDDGRVLLSGGYNESWWSKHKTQAPFEIYDPAKGKFEKIGSIFSRFKSKEGRMNHTATSIENGTAILLTGGNRYEGGYLFGLVKPKLKMNSAAEVVRGNATEKTADLNTPRMFHAAAAVTPRNVLVGGGHDPNEIHKSLELFDSATGAWTSVGDMVQRRTGCQIVPDKNMALIIGGTDGTKEVETVEVFDADAKAMSSTTYTMVTGRNNFTATKLKDGRILVIGGFSGATSLDGLDGQPVASAEVFVRQ